MLLFYTPLTQLPASIFVLETKWSCFLPTFWRLSRQTMPITRRIEVRPRIYFRCLQWNYKELKVILAKLVITFTLHFICLTRWTYNDYTVKQLLILLYKSGNNTYNPLSGEVCRFAIILKVVLFLRDAYNVRPS